MAWRSLFRYDPVTDHRIIDVDHPDDKCWVRFYDQAGQRRMVTGRNPRLSDPGDQQVLFLDRLRDDQLDSTYAAAIPIERIVEAQTALDVSRVIKAQRVRRELLAAGIRYLPLQSFSP